jgi:hypothetical protein
MGEKWLSKIFYASISGVTEEIEDEYYYEE